MAAFFLSLTPGEWTVYVASLSYTVALLQFALIFRRVRVRIR